ncbi:MAG TPA: DUF4149 domain-containing protein [Polyangia bacterium]|nr:DUF4149 domain-containing protein [Polyangia bacterium]
MSAGRRRVAALAETLGALAIVAWVGGHAALGAFAARIVFRDLPRAMAAPTMNSIFRSFDELILAALIVLAIATVARVAAAGLERRADRVALGAALGLLLVGALEIAYVHPSIEAMFVAGRTLEPEFASLHKLSERCGHVEVALAALWLGALAWARASSAPAAA